MRGKPTCVIAHTTKGKGVSFMENRIAWHYLPMSDSDFARALAELTQRGRTPVTTAQLAEAVSIAKGRAGTRLANIAPHADGESQR